MIRKLFSSQLRINMVSGVAAMLLNTVVLAAGYPIYLHFLGYEQYGVWLVLATVLTFAQLGNLGINQAVTKLVAEEYGRGDTLAIQQYVTTALAILGLSGIVVLSGLLVLKGPIVAAFNLGEGNAKIALWLLPYVGLLSIYVFLTEVLQGTLSGLGRMDLANYIRSLSGVVKLGVSACLLIAGLGIESLLIAAIVSRLMMHAMDFLYIRRIVNLRMLCLDNLDVPRGRHLLRFGGAVFGCSLLNMLVSPFNKLMLSRYVGVAAIPIYDIACNGSMQIRGLIETGLRPLMPEISRLQSNMSEISRNRIRKINRRALGIVLGLGLPVYGVLMLAATPLLRVWLQQSFLTGLPEIFRIMLIASFVSLLGFPAFHTLVGLGMVRYTLVGYLIQSLASVLVVGVLFLFCNERSVQATAVALLLAVGLNMVYLTSVRIRRV